MQAISTEDVAGVLIVATTLGILFLAGCGTATQLTRDDVAVLGHHHITKAMLGTVLRSQLRSFSARDDARRIPARRALRDQAMIILVQQAEQEEDAENHGIRITDATFGSASHRSRALFR